MMVIVVMIMIVMLINVETLLSGVARSLLSWHRRIPREITCQIYMSSLHNYIVSSTRSSYTDLIRILYWSSMNQRDFSVGFAWALFIDFCLRTFRGSAMALLVDLFTPCEIIFSYNILSISQRAQHVQMWRLRYFAKSQQTTLVV